MAARAVRAVAVRGDSRCLSRPGCLGREIHTTNEIRDGNVYSYENERPKLFTDDGQRMFLQIRDNVHDLLETAGAFRCCSAFFRITGDTWLMFAAIDRLVELREIREITHDGVAAQNRVFVREGLNTEVLCSCFQESRDRKS